jgi:5-methylcytosine-specific restriction endonuclease McrA
MTDATQDRAAKKHSKRRSLQKYRARWCADCGGRSDLTVHHKVPVSRGGTTAWGNLITLCEECHRRRHVDE